MKGLADEVQTQSGDYSEDSWIKSNSWQDEQANIPHAASIDRSTASQNTTDSHSLM